MGREPGCYYSWWACQSLFRCSLFLLYVGMLLVHKFWTVRVKHIVPLEPKTRWSIITLINWCWAMWRRLSRHHSLDKSIMFIVSSFFQHQSVLCTLLSYLTCIAGLISLLTLLLALLDSSRTISYSHTFILGLVSYLFILSYLHSRTPLFSFHIILHRASCTPLTSVHSALMAPPFQLMPSMGRCA